MFKKILLTIYRNMIKKRKQNKAVRILKRLEKMTSGKYIFHKSLQEIKE